VFDIAVTDEVVAHAVAAVGEGKFGNRGIADGNRVQQITGLIGQTVVHDLFRVPRPKDRGRADGGVDFVLDGMSVDVKTMGRVVRPLPNYVNNFSGLQLRRPAEAFVFCSLNRQNRVLTVCGWTTLIDLLECAKLNPAGSTCRRANGSTFVAKANLYQISNLALYPSPTFDDLLSLMQLQAALFAEARRRGRYSGAQEYAKAA